MGKARKPAATPDALVESATLPGERRLFTTPGWLRGHESERAAGPVVMCVGDVFAESCAMDPVEAEKNVRRAAQTQ